MKSVAGETVIGFTGTQQGMTLNQMHSYIARIKQLWELSDVLILHHGDCVGADDEADKMFGLLLGKIHSKQKEKLGCVYIHPPSDPKKRAWCKSRQDADQITRVLLGEMPYLERNKQIVDYSDVLIATPKGFAEELRSGTWSTVRYARKQKKSVVIIYPDGRIELEP